MSQKVSPDGEEEYSGDPPPEGEEDPTLGGLEDEESSDEEEDESDTGLTENQNRLLYIVKLYTHAARTEDEKEEWVRKQALMVLVYEGVVAQVLDYDYAPASDLVEMRRKYFNVSQEGKSDIDFLREEELINGLKLSSKDYQPVTCFQISEKGEELVKKLGKADKEAVHELVYAPGTRELLKVTWTGDGYDMNASSGYSRPSTVTDTEDVSYVSSAYVPQCLRHGGRPTLSNAHRAHECGTGESAIRDELDEVITLNSVSIIVAEYIPFGANQVVQMNNNLGSTERVQGGFFTALIDEDSSGTKFEVPPGLTSVNILDYTLTNHINFEADIHFPVEAGVVQVETFGVSVNSDGTIFYGMQIEAVMDRIKDNISLDHLSRLLVDVHIDSSKIVDSVISAYQRSLLDLIFMNDAASRDKVNLIIANEITPHLTAEEYMDKGEYENELKQVLGDTRAAFDISEHDTLIFGAHGLLVAGPNSRHHEPLLCSYLQFQSMDIFIQNFFNRMFIVLDDMKVVRSLIYDNEKDPNSIAIIRGDLATVSQHVILLEEVLGYLRESLGEMAIPPEPPEQAGRSLYERLEIAEMKDQLLRRTSDLVKNTQGARHELEMLREMSNIVSETKSFALQEAVNVNTRQLCSLQESNEKSSKSLSVVQLLLAGSLTFDILDRFTGEWTVVNTEWMQSFVTVMFKQNPSLWFFLNVFIMVLFGFLLSRFMKWLAYKAQGEMTLRLKVQRPIDRDALQRYLGLKNLCQEDREYTGNNEIVKVAWVEADKREWGFFAPRICVEYDERNAFLLNVSITYNRRWASKALGFSAEELKDRLESEFDLNGLFNNPTGGLVGLTRHKENQLKGGGANLMFGGGGDDDDDLKEHQD